MKIINANAGYLTNAEVFDLLREQAPSVEENKYEFDQKESISCCLEYLKDSSSEKLAEFFEALEFYKFKEEELMQLANFGGSVREVPVITFLKPYGEAIGDEVYLAIQGILGQDAECLEKFRAAVEARKRSSATVDTRKTSSAAVETQEISSADVETREISSAAVETGKTGSAAVETQKISSAAVETGKTGSPEKRKTDQTKEISASSSMEVMKRKRKTGVAESPSKKERIITRDDIQISDGSGQLNDKPEDNSYRGTQCLEPILEAECVVASDPEAIPAPEAKKRRRRKANPSGQDAAKAAPRAMKKKKGESTAEQSTL